MEVQRPIYFSGRVMMDDGTAPPEPVTIMMVCGGHPRPQAYTDNKGRFSFSPGQNQGMFADASTGGFGDVGGLSRSSSRNTMPGMGRGMSSSELMSCELRADLPGFRSDNVNLAGRRSLDNPDVGTIVLHRLANVEGFTYSMTTANAPKEAKKAYDKGKDLAKKGKSAEAEAQFQKAVEAYPKYALAWSELGKLQAQQKKNDVAHKSFEQAVEADPKYVDPHLGLLQLDVAARDWNRIAEESEKVVKLNPYNYPQAWFFNSVANYNLGKKDVAEKSAKEASKLDVDHKNPKISHLLGLLLAERGDYAGAKDQLLNYLNFAPLAPDADAVKKQLGELERVMGAKAQGQNPQQQ
jgi:tetratricopeptide (TPR) repeat protein